MNNISCLIVDDEPKAINVLKNLLADFEDISIVATASSVNEAVSAVIDHKPDLVFLDVQMPVKNGFELIHEIKDFVVQTTIIFVTAYDEYAIEAIRHSAFDFLTKPVRVLELQKAIQRFQADKQKETKANKYDELLERIAPKKLKFKTRSSTVFINPNDIVYVQADGNYAEIFLSGLKSEYITGYLSTVHEQLPSSTFIRINRSVVINSKFLSKIDRKKKLCYINHEGRELSFQIPVKYIRKLNSNL